MCQLATDINGLWGTAPDLAPDLASPVAPPALSAAVATSLLFATNAAFSPPGADIESEMVARCECSWFAPAGH